MNRVVYIDWIRVIACFAVILFHVSGSCGYTIEKSMQDHIMMELFHSIVIWCVPIFIMISGALFLNSEKKICIKKLYTHNVFRIVTAFIFWSFVYASYNFIGSDDSNRIRGYVIQFLGGHFHMWFLWLIVGLYILTPIFRQISNNRKIMGYLILISIIFNFTIPFLFSIINIFFPVFSPVGELIQSYLINLNLQVIGGYITYFFLGYYLSTMTLDKKREYVIVALGIIASIAIVGLAYLSFIKEYSSRGEFFQFCSLLVMVQSVSIFIICKRNFYNNERKTISFFSKYSFGIYLVHMLVIYVLVLYGMIPTIINPIIGILIMSLLTFFISIGIVAIISRVPYLNKWCL